MSSLATERFRTLITAPMEDEADRIYSGGEPFDEDAVAQKIVDQFPEAHYAHKVNDAGVAMRRVIVASRWEVDPEETALPRCGDQQCPSFGDKDFGEGTCPVEHALSGAVQRPSSAVPTQAMVDAVRAALNRAEMIGDNPVLAVLDAVLPLAGGAQPRGPVGGRDEVKRRMLSVLDGTALNEADEVAEALADSAIRWAGEHFTGVHVPRRDDAVAAWLKAHRDEGDPGSGDEGEMRAYEVTDDLLDDYRLHADTGTPLHQHVMGPGGPESSDCPNLVEGGCGCPAPGQADSDIAEAIRVAAELERASGTVDPGRAHQFIGTIYKGQRVDMCSNYARLPGRSHEAIMCGASADDPIHQVNGGQ